MARSIEEVEKESREQIFDRLAVGRTNAALKRIRLLENLKAYPHNAKKSAAIVGAWKAAVEKVEYALGGEREAKREDSFSFGDDF